MMLVRDWGEDSKLSLLVVVHELVHEFVVIFGSVDAIETAKDINVEALTPIVVKVSASPLDRRTP